MQWKNNRSNEKSYAKHNHIDDSYKLHNNFANGDDKNNWIKIN